MGCMDSKPRVHPMQQRPIIDFDDFDGQIEAQKQALQQQQQKQASKADIINFLNQSFNGILQGISKIPKPPSLQPIVCLSINTTPLVLGTLYISKSGDSTNVSLPAMAIGVYGKGKTVMIGHIGLLADCYQSNTEASALLENIARYVCGNRMTVRVLILGVTTNTSNQIKKNLSVFEIFCDISKEPLETYTKYAAIICTTEFTHPAAIKAYVTGGGGLICGFAEPSNLENPSEYPMQKLLLEFGYGVPECSLQIGPPNTNSLKSERPFASCNKITFPSLVDSYVSITSDPDSLNVSEYDTLVTTLRYHIISLMRLENDELKTLNETAWKYLDATEASSPEFKSVGPQLVHGITFVLISEMMRHIPAKYFEKVDRSWPFPGRVDENIIELADYKTHVEFHCASWFSTGLYLPPGVISTVTLERAIPNISVQVGAHSEYILSKLGPWKRWPIVDACFEFKEETIEISSPFGGIVYIVADDVLEDEMLLEFDVTFRNIGRHPSFITSSPESYTESRNVGIPWGELETQFIIFTLPTEMLEAIPNLQETCDFIDDIVAKVLTFTSDESIRLFRVVFDVELNDDAPVLGYPLVLDLAMADGIFLKSSEPTAEMFVLLTYIAMVSMPDEIFEKATMESFAMIAAIHAFSTTWIDCEPLEFAMNAPAEIFDALFKIYQENDKGALPKAFAKVRDSATYMCVQQQQQQQPLQSSNSPLASPATSPTKTIANSPKDHTPSSFWKVFVQKLSMGTRDYSRDLLKESFSMKTQPGHMIMSYSSNSLSGYQLDETLASSSPIV